MVRDKAKGCKAKFGNCTVKFCKSICTIVGSADDNHRAEVSGLCLASEVSLNTGVSDKDKGAWLEVEVTNGVLEGVFELADGVEAAVEDIGMDGGKVGFAFLELACADCKEFVGVEWLGNVRDEEGG